MRPPYRLDQFLCPRSQVDDGQRTQVGGFPLCDELLEGIGHGDFADGLPVVLKEIADNNVQRCLAVQFLVSGLGVGCLLWRQPSYHRAGRALQVGRLDFKLLHPGERGGMVCEVLPNALAVQRPARYPEGYVAARVGEVQNPELTLALWSGPASVACMCLHVQNLPNLLANVKWHFQKACKQRAKPLLCRVL